MSRRTSSSGPGSTARSTTTCWSRSRTAGSPGSRPGPTPRARRRLSRASPSPGLANCHSHAFHRALRGRTQRERGTFWTWRDQMYDVAGAARSRLLLRAGAGDLPRDGRGWDHHAWVSSTTCTTSQTARRTTTRTRWAQRSSRRPARPGSGSRCWTPATCRAGSGEPPEGVQRPLLRRRRRGLGGARPGRRPGGASTRSGRCRATSCRSFHGRAPLHVHLSEQVAENEACLAAYGVTPARLLHEADLLGPDTTVVHATHLTEDDIELLGTTGTNVCISPDHRARPRRTGSARPRGWPAPAAGSRSAATAMR